MGFFILDFKIVLMLPISSTYVSSPFFAEILEMPMPIFFKTNHTCRGSFFILTNHPSASYSDSSAPFPQKLLRSFQLTWPLLSSNLGKPRVKSCLRGALTPQCGNTWFDASLLQGKTSLHLPAASPGQKGSSGDILPSAAQHHTAP